MLREFKEGTGDRTRPRPPQEASRGGPGSRAAPISFQGARKDMTRPPSGIPWAEKWRGIRGWGSLAIQTLASCFPEPSEYQVLSLGAAPCFQVPRARLTR